MPNIKTLSGCRIVIYPRDHCPPHVHVVFRDGDRCKVEIMSLQTIGTVRPARKLAKPLAWIEANQESLLRKWDEIVQ